VSPFVICMPASQHQSQILPRFSLHNIGDRTRRSSQQLCTNTTPNSVIRVGYACRIQPMLHHHGLMGMHVGFNNELGSPRPPDGFRRRCLGLAMCGMQPMGHFMLSTAISLVLRLATHVNDRIGTLTYDTWSCQPKIRLVNKMRLIPSGISKWISSPHLRYCNPPLRPVS
jgi:hypothetical protein